MLIVSEQVWFKACAKEEKFEPFPTVNISAWKGSTENLNCKILVGRGPLKRNIFSLPNLFLSYEPEVSPNFATPNRTGELAASVMMRTPQQNWIELLDHEVGLLIEVYAMRDAPYDMLGQYKNGISVSVRSQQTDEASIKNLVKDLYCEIERRLDILIGLYVIRHFALVWQPLHRARQLIQIDSQTNQAQLHDERSLASPIPYQFNRDAQEALWVTRLPIEEISNSKVHIPLVFLQNALWEQQAHIRFLHEFWVLEYFADLYSKKDMEMVTFVENLEHLIEIHLASHLNLFVKVKQDLLRNSLINNLKACFQRLSLPFEEDIVMQAKQVRDQLSHGQNVDEAKILDAESGIRHLPALLIRKHLEAYGINLDGA